MPGTDLHVTSNLQVSPSFLPLAAAFLLASAPVFAESGDVVRPYASYTFAYDDNVLGLPNPRAAAALTGSSSTDDRSRSIQAGIQIDKTVSRQRLTANGSVSDVRHDRYTMLDYQGRDLSAEWEWHVGNHVEGQLKSSYKRSLASFDDYHVLEKRLTTERRWSGSLRWRFHPRWRFGGALSRYDIAYRSPSAQNGDRTEEWAEASLEYIRPAGNTLGIAAKQVKGSYPVGLPGNRSLMANDFDQDELLVRGLWKATGKTALQFNGGRVSRTHKSSAAKDFSGFNTRTSLDWAITEATFLNVAVWRELGFVDDLLTAYSINKGIGIGPRWSMSAKLQADVQLRRETREFRASQAFMGIGVSGDTSRSAQALLSYMPDDRWLLQTTLIYMKRDGRGRLTGFDRNAANITLKYQF